MKNPIILPNGDLIHGDQIATVNHYVDSGISLKGEKGNSLAFVREADDAKAIHIRNELIKVVQACYANKKYQPNFDLPQTVEKGTDKEPAKK